jgi:enolase
MSYVIKKISLACCLTSLDFTDQNNDGSHKISGDSLKDLYKSFVSEYPIVSIEDPFDQDDWATYAKMTSEIGQQVQIVGDDLLVTNPTVSYVTRFTSTKPQRKTLLRAFPHERFELCRGLPRQSVRRPATLFS